MWNVRKIVLLVLKAISALEGGHLASSLGPDVPVFFSEPLQKSCNHVGETRGCSPLEGRVGDVLMTQRPNLPSPVLKVLAANLLLDTLGYLRESVPLPYR